jgi:hypothetical protein
MESIEYSALQSNYNNGLDEVIDENTVLFDKSDDDDIEIDLTQSIPKDNYKDIFDKIILFFKKLKF